MSYRVISYHVISSQPIDMTWSHLFHPFVFSFPRLIEKMFFTQESFGASVKAVTTRCVFVNQGREKSYSGSYLHYVCVYIYRYGSSPSKFGVFGQLGRQRILTEPHIYTSIPYGCGSFFSLSPPKEDPKMDLPYQFKETSPDIASFRGICWSFDGWWRRKFKNSRWRKFSLVYIYIYGTPPPKKNLPVCIFYWYLQSFFAYLGTFFLGIFFCFLRWC